MKRARWIVGGVAVALAAVALAGQYSSPLPARWTEARPGWLYRSAQIPAANVAAVLREQHIDLVIDLTDDPNDPDFEPEAAAASALGVRYLSAPVSPNHAEAIQSYAQAVAAIAKAHARGERVLVHCELGHRRSAAAIALYARLIEHEPPDVAYRELFRYADSRAAWQAVMRESLEQNLPEIETRLRTELAK